MRSLVKLVTILDPTGEVDDVRTALIGSLKGTRRYVGLIILYKVKEMYSYDCLSGLLVSNLRLSRDYYCVREHLFFTSLPFSSSKKVLI